MLGRSTKRKNMKENKIIEIIKSFESKVTTKINSFQLQPNIIEFKEEETEMKFSLNDNYEFKIFIALAQKHKLKPYRKPKQKKTTVILKASKTYLDECFWPEFVSLSDDLDVMLEEITEEVIKNTLLNEKK
jgi:hypothetical protein